MKQKIHYLFMLLLMLLTGVGGVKAEEKTIVIKYNSEFSPALPTSSSAVNSNITEHKVLGLNVKEKEIYKTSGYLMFVQNKGYIFNSEDLGTIKSVTVKYSSGCSTSAKAGVYFGSEQQSAYLSTNNKTIAGTSKSDTWTNTITGNGFFQLSTSNKNCQITQIVIVYDASASSNKENVDLSFGEISSQTVGVGKTVKIEATATPSVPISYSSSDETIAIVSTDGTVTGKKPGKTTIKASFAGNEQYNSASDEYELTVIPSELGGDVTEETITINEPYGNSGNNAIILYDKGTNPQNGPFYSNSELRLYCGNTLTVSSESKKIAKIEFDLVINKNSSNTIPESITCTSGSCEDFNKLSTSLTSAVWNAPTKNGVSEVTFTINGSAGNVGFKSAKVYYVLKSFDVAPASNNESYGTVSFEEGVITATPAEGYRVSLTNPYKVTPDGAATVVQDGNDFTVTATADCTVQINFEAIPTHTATFSVNGTETSMSFAEGSPITFDTPDDVQGKKFVGWTTAAIDGTTDECPELVTLGTMGNADVKYYAVFANGNVTVTSDKYTLDYANETGLAGSTEWGSYGKTYAYTASDGGNWTVKAYKNGGMQINSGKDASIKIPECAGDIASIEIVGSTAKAVGLSESDYSGSGTITYIVEGTDAKEQTLDLSGKAVRTGYIVPKSGSIVITKVVVNYSKTEGTYSDYCTTVVAPVKPAKPIVFHDGGEGVTYEGELTVPMFAEEGATIYYTTDDTEPTAASTEYTKPLNISTNTTLKAIAVKDGVESDVVTREYTIVEKAKGAVVEDGYYTIQTNDDDGKYVNVAGRKTVTLVSDTKSAGTVIRVKADEDGVKVLRSQAVDLPRYAERAMSYVPEIVKEVVKKLAANVDDPIIGEQGADLILDKFKKEFDYHLYLEGENNTYRIYGRTPSMKPVVDFYAENKELVDSRLPKVEKFVKEVLQEIVNKVGRGQSVVDMFKVKTIWQNMGGKLTDPDVDQAKFFEEVLSSEKNTWEFAYQTGMLYWEKVKGYLTDNISELGDYGKYIEKIPQIRPNFRYYIVPGENGVDIISEGNSQITDASTAWTLTKRDGFDVTFDATLSKNNGKEMYKTLYVDFGYKLPDGVTALKVTAIDENTGVAKTEEIGQEVAPQTPVLLKSDKAGDITLTIGDNFGSAVTDNQLVGADYLINKYEINTPQVESIFTLLANLSKSLANEYSYLKRKNAGTVNNKYFFGLTKDDLKLCYYLNDNEEKDCVVRSLSMGDEKLGFYNNWTAKANEAFLVSEQFNPVKLTLKGDVNRDGSITIADVTALVNIILGKATYPADADKYDFEAAHVNADEDITIADVTALVNIILGK